MKTTLKVERPHDIMFTMSITMSAREWESLRDQLQTKWPSYELTRNINDLLSQATKVFQPHEPDNEA